MSSEFKFDFATFDTNSDVRTLQVADAFTIDIRYCSPTDVRAMSEEVTVVKFVAGKKTETQDQSRLRELFVKKFVVGWDVTYQVINDILPFSPAFRAKLKEAGLTMESKVPFDVKNVAALFGNSPELESLVFQFAYNRNNYIDKSAVEVTPEELKN